MLCLWLLFLFSPSMPVLSPLERVATTSLLELVASSSKPVSSPSKPVWSSQELVRSFSEPVWGPSEPVERPSEPVQGPQNLFRAPQNLLRASQNLFGTCLQPRIPYLGPLGTGLGPRKTVLGPRNPVSDPVLGPSEHFPEHCKSVLRSLEPVLGHSEPILTPENLLPWLFTSAPYNTEGLKGELVTQRQEMVSGALPCPLENIGNWLCLSVMFQRNFFQP